MDGTRADPAPVRSEHRCPHCTDSRVQRWGKPNGSQRYRCRNCGRTFNALTGTACAGLRRAELWVDYRAAIVEQLSIRKAAERCGIDPSTALRWRRRLAGDAANGPAPKGAARASGRSAISTAAELREAVDFVDWAHAMRTRDGSGAMRAHLDGMFGLGTAAGKSAAPGPNGQRRAFEAPRPGKPSR